MGIEIQITDYSIEKGDRLIVEISKLSQFDGGFNDEVKEIIDLSHLIDE